MFGSEQRLLFDSSHKILRPIHANTLLSPEYPLPVGNGRAYAVALTYSRVHFYNEFNGNIDGTIYDSASIGPGYVRRGALMDINLWGQNLLRFFTYTQVTPLRLTPNPAGGGRDVLLRAIDMNITEQQLQQIFPNPREQAGVFVSMLNNAMGRREINTRQRQAAFLAQIGHESGQLRYVRERGSDEYLSRYDTGALARLLDNPPEADGDG